MPLLGLGIQAMPLSGIQVVPRLQSLEHVEPSLPPKLPPPPLLQPPPGQPQLLTSPGTTIPAPIVLTADVTLEGLN